MHPIASKRRPSLPTPRHAFCSSRCAGFCSRMSKASEVYLSTAPLLSLSRCRPPRRLLRPTIARTRPVAVGLGRRRATGRDQGRLPRVRRRPWRCSRRDRPPSRSTLRTHARGCGRALAPRPRSTCYPRRGCALAFLANDEIFALPRSPPPISSRHTHTLTFPTFCSSAFPSRWSSNCLQASNLK